MNPLRSAYEYVRTTTARKAYFRDMNRTIIVAIMLIGACLTSLAQPYPIGSRNITLTDPARNNRSIGCQVYYPATTAGSNATVANGQFPVIVVGHGFSMAVGAYENWWTEFVPEGYIFILPTTEVGPIPFPSHPDFGLDIAFAASEAQAWNTNASSPFFGKVAPRTALMGHSMGGGCSFLAAENNSMIDCILGLAPAETNTSAIAAAANVTAPTMILWGTEDEVTPEASHALAIYNGLTSNCKTYVRIDQGAHCFFANYNFFCATGEMNIGTLSREGQQQTSYALARPFFEYFLKDDCNAYDDWVNALATTPNLGTNILGCPNDAPTIVDNSGTLESDAQVNYQWFLDGTPIQGAEQQNYVYSQSGTYQVGTINIGSCYVYSNEITIQPTGLEDGRDFAELVSVADGWLTVNFRSETELLAVEWMDASGRSIAGGTQFEWLNNGSLRISLPAVTGLKLIRVSTDRGMFVWKLL